MSSYPGARKTLGTLILYVPTDPPKEQEPVQHSSRIPGADDSLRESGTTGAGLITDHPDPSSTKVPNEGGMDPGFGCSQPTKQTFRVKL